MDGGGHLWWGIFVCGCLGVWGHHQCGVWLSIGGRCRLCVGCGHPCGVCCCLWVGRGRPLMESCCLWVWVRCHPWIVECYGSSLAVNVARPACHISGGAVWLVPPPLPFFVAIVTVVVVVIFIIIIAVVAIVVVVIVVVGVVVVVRVVTDL